jgi:hypothetical protein
MEIAIVGVGGVGGYFGGKLAHAARRIPGSRVSCLARGAHLAAIRRMGITLDCDEGLLSCVPSFAVDDAADLPPAGLPEDEYAKWLERRSLDREKSVEKTLALLAAAGFSRIECVYRFMKFAVIVALKG